LSFLLPFAVLAEDRRERFGKDMQYATIFCLAEMGRNKGGLILKKSPEEIAFIAECCYPIWCAPWDRTTLFFDGLGLRRHTLSLDILPDMDAFIRDLNTSAGKPETYLDFLTRNISYFQNLAGMSKKFIDGLITDPDFLKDFASFFSKAKRVKAPMSDRAILTPFMDETVIRTWVDSLLQLRSNLETDVRKLNRIVKTLVRLTDKHSNALTRKNEKSMRKAEKDINRLRNQASRKAKEMQRLYESKILEISKTAESQLPNLRKVRDELENRRTQLSVYAKKCETEISSFEARGETIGLDRWREELQKCKDQLSELEKNVSEVEANIRNVEQTRDVGISQAKAEFDAQTETLMAGLKKIEAARDAEIASNQKRIGSLKELTSTYMVQINKLFDLRKSALADLGKIGLPRARKRYALIYVPFYLGCYQQESKRRYVLYPPSSAHGLRGVTKIKGVFKTSKVEVVLDDLSKSTTMFLNKFLRLISENPMFEEKLVQACAKINILKGKESCKKAEKGLERLKDEGWLSTNELQSFKDQLAQTCG